MNNLPLKCVSRLVYMLTLSLLCQSLHGQVYTIERLGEEINTKAYDEICPILSPDGHSLYFTRVGSPDFEKTLMKNNQDISTSNPTHYLHTLGRIYSEIARTPITNPVQSEYNQDIYIAHLKDDDIQEVIHPGYPLNSALPNSLCSLTPNSNRYVVINQYEEKGGMHSGFSYIEKDEKGNFSFPESIRFADFYTLGEEVGFSMAPDGNAVVMALDREDSYGDQDLYVSFKINDHYWSLPTNMGPTINSPYRETAPFVSKNNNRLFFSSNRDQKSGFDIYFSSRQGFSWKNWIPPKKLPEPINSPFDDSHPFFNDNNDDLYFISTRDGSSDIYKTNLIPIIRVRKNVIIRGRIVDADSGKLTKGILNYGPADEEDYPYFFNTHSGRFTVKLSFKDDFRFTVEKLGHISTEVILDPDLFDEGLESNKYEMVIKVQSSHKKEFIDIGHLVFKKSKPILEKKSLPELNRLVRTLKQNKYLQIRVEGHTDNVGDKDAKIILSKDRADAVKKYLISKSISSGRISTQGFGDSRPLNDNLTEEDKRINRRVEIRIIRK